MPRIYVTNDSFPELREVRPRRRQTLTWIRAIAHAIRFIGFLPFVAVQVVLLGVACSPLVTIAMVAPEWVELTSLGAAAVALMTLAYFQVSWGGDIMRSHLRAVNDIARHACPACGQDLRGHLDEGDEPIICPECGASIPRDVFEPPFPIPRQFRAFPPWKTRASPTSLSQ